LRESHHRVTDAVGMRSMAVNVTELLALPREEREIFAIRYRPRCM
jgi:hypothetical protein